MIDRSKLKSPREWIAATIGTACGAGIVPRIPGTMGTLFAVPLVYFSNTWDTSARVILWLAILYAGTWSAKVLDESMGSNDNQSIVIDEVLGYGITAWTCGQNPLALATAFVLFRAFDILKPPPVRQMDRWSKKKAKSSDVSGKWWGGFGVMADDGLAGIQGLLVVLFFQQIHWL